MSRQLRAACRYLARLAGVFLCGAALERGRAQSLIAPVPTYPLSLPSFHWEDARGIASTGSVEGAEGQLLTVELEDGRYIVIKVVPDTAVSQRKFRLRDRVAFSGHIAYRQLIADSVQMLSHAAAPSASNHSATPNGVAIDPVITKTRDQVDQYSKLLPDFICEQTTRRFVRTPQRGMWFPLDTYAVEVLFSTSAGETYRDLRLNGKRVTKSLLEMQGSVSTGEFGSLLRSILRNAQPGEFEFVKETRVEKRSAREYAFSVTEDRSDWQVVSDFQFVLAAYRGHIWIDAETNRVLRLERQSENLPPAFPVARVQSTLQYGNVRLTTEGNLYLLPLRAEMIGCQRSNGSCTRNTIAFDHYRKYSEDSKLIF